MRTRIATLEEFRQYQAACMAAREAQKRRVLVCCGTGCVAGGSLKVYEAFKQKFAEHGLKCKTELALDCGGILLVKRASVSGKTCGELSEELSALSAQAALEAVDLLERGENQLLVQDEARATYCKKITKADAEVDFTKSGEEVARLINAMSPSPAAYCNLSGSPVNLLRAAPCEGSGEVGTVLSADKRGIVVACGKGAVNVTQIQFSGGKPICAADAVNGRKIKAGDHLD